MSDHESLLLNRAAEGDQSAIGELLTLHAPRIKRMLAIRMDSRLKSRLDESDVFQELQLDAIQRLSEFMSDQSVSFFVWLRFLARQKLAQLTRHNIHVQARDARREQHPLRIANATSSIALANFLIGNITSPSLQIARQEINQLIEQAIGSLDENDREVILLRHVEQLTTAEAACELKISPNTCRQRHLRALKRLKALLEAQKLDWVNSDG